MLRILPRAPDIFVGRQAERERMLSAFAARCLFVIEGIGGIGKTSFALHLADHLEKERPGRVYWISCQSGWQVESFIGEILGWLPREAREAYEVWLRGAPAELRDRFLYLVNLLNREGAVVFVDDFHLLEGSHVAEILKVLKTYLRGARFFLVTRERPQLPPVDMLDLVEAKLDGLGAQDGAALLQSLVAGMGEIAALPASLVKRGAAKFGGHPLLTKTFAALVLEGLGDPGALLENLPDYFQEMERELFLQIMHGLTPQEEELLQLLCVSRAPLEREFLRERHLRENLERRFLLLKDGQGRFSVHSLIREFILRDLDPYRKELLHQRLAGHFLDYLERNPGELEIVRETLYHFREAGRADEVISLLVQFGGKLCSKGYYEELLSFIDSVAIDDHRIIVLKAHVLSLTGRQEQSRELLAELEENLQNDGHLPAVFSALGGAYLNAGNLAASLEYFRKALRLYRERNDRRHSLKPLNCIAYIHAYRSEREKALDAGGEALELARELNDEAGVAYNFRMRSVAFLDAGRYADALAASNECLKKGVAVSSLRLQCWALLNNASALSGLGRFDEAQASIDEARRLGESSLDLTIIAHASWAQASLAWEMDDRGALPAAFARAQDDFRRQGNDLCVAAVQYEKARYLLEEGKHRDAEALLSGAAQTACANGHFGLELRCREALAVTLLMRGEAAQAQKLASQNMEALSRVRRAESAGEAHLALAEAAWRLNERAKVEEHLRAAIAIVREEPLDYVAVRALHLAGRISGEKKEVRAAWLDEAEGLLEKLEGSRKRLAPRYIERVDELTAERYFVRTADGERILQKDEVESLRARRGEFSLFIDLPGAFVHERDLGEVNILGKRIISTLLVYLVKHAGKGMGHEQIFSSVWGYPFDDLSSPGEVRKNISRLRKLIEPEGAAGRYIRQVGPFMKQKGSYCFDTAESFCLIEKL